MGITELAGSYPRRLDAIKMNKEVIMNERGNYFRIARDQWQDFYTPGNTPLTQAELDNIKSLNDQISMKDVADVANFKQRLDFASLCEDAAFYYRDRR